MDEVPYMIDSKVYVARKTIGEAEYSKMDEKNKDGALRDPKIALYGMINQSLIDSYTNMLQKVYDRKTGIKGMERTMNNANLKVRKHKDSASTAAVREAKEIGRIGLHPLILENVDEDEKGLMEIQETLRAFRPQMNAIEHSY